MSDNLNKERVGRNDFNQPEVKTNKELYNLKKELCKVLELEDSSGFSCTHFPQHLFISNDMLIDEVSKLKNERDQLREEINKLRIEFDERITKLEKEKDDIFKREIKRHDKEIYDLKEILGKNPKWQKRGNSYYRWNSDVEKEERCKVPRNFDITKLEIDEYVNETSFSYKYHDDEYQSIHDTKEKPIMDISLYDQLEKEQKIKDEKARLSTLDIHNVKTWEDMKDYIYSIGDVPRGKHIEKMGRFIIKKYYGIGEFTTEELDKEIGFKNRKTRRAYCKKFIKWEFIDETKTEGTYKIIF